jgi:hypothetical protein
MIRKIFPIALTLLALMLFGSPRWPIPQMKDIFITSHFGDNRGDHFHSGIDIASSSLPLIYPVDNGELIFYYDNSESFYPQTFGTGKTVILQHSQMKSYYSHLEEILVKNKTLLDTSTAIGKMGDTGRSTGPHLHLSLKKGNQYINPAKILPPLKDGTSPFIKNVFLRAGYYQRRIQPDSPDPIALPLRKSFKILINAYDPSSWKRRRMVYKISVRITDESKKPVFSKEVVFDQIQDGRIAGNYTTEELFETIWNEDFMLLGEWVDKSRKNQYLFQVSVEDYSGNRDRMTKRIYFR